MEMSGTLPKRAAVRPRVCRTDGNTPLLLEEEIASLLEGNEPADVVLTGRPGSGRRSAFAHLAHVFAGDARLQLGGELEEPMRAGVMVRVRTTSATRHRYRNPVEAADLEANEASQDTETVRLKLQPWSDDDVLEYLLSRHADDVARVLPIWQQDTTHDLHRWPATCTAVLDQLAERPELLDMRSALALVMALEIGDHYVEAVTFAITTALVDCKVNTPQSDRSPRALKHLWHLLGSKTVLGTLAAQWVLEVAQQQAGRSRILPWSSATRDAIEHALRSQTDLASTLDRIARRPRVRQKGFLFGALSLLRPGYRPARALRGDLRWAWLHGVDLSNQHIKARLEGANLGSTNLSGCTFERTPLAHSNLVNARANNAQFVDMLAWELTATGLEAPGSAWFDAHLQDSNLCNAVLDRASLENAQLNCCNLSRASLRRANLSKAVILRSVLDAADLTDADCSSARFHHADLRAAILEGTNFIRAHLHSCNFEGTELPRLRAASARFTRCDLTASHWPNADLRNASFAECGLAHVDWQGSDLRGADLRRATFHLGNSRSGLVDSLTAGQGSRTGYYTDESLEERFQTPEDVRKANLRDCDLRGAIVEATDFYLVDVRGAKMTLEQRVWMQRCRAIMGPT